MLTRRRIALTAAAVLFGVVWLVSDFGTASALLVLVVFIAAIAYAVGALAQGQSEWFGRDQERRDRRR